MEWNEAKFEHMRVFGCIVYAHVPDHICKKFCDKAKKYIFIGYNNVTKEYKLYNPKKDKVIISCDVILDEQSSWDWSSKEISPAKFVPLEDNSINNESVVEPKVQSQENQSPKTKLGGMLEVLTSPCWLFRMLSLLLKRKFG